MKARSTIFRTFSLCAAAAIAALLSFSAPASAAQRGQRYAKRNATYGSTGVVVEVTGRGSSFLPKATRIYPPGVPLIGGKPVPMRLPGVGIYVPQQLPPPAGTITLPACLTGSMSGAGHWHFTPIVVQGTVL